MIDYSAFHRYIITPDGKIIGIKGKQMKTFIDKDGYEIVGLMDDNKKKHIVKVHRLVATKYIPNNDPSLTVNHKDGNKMNNSVDNLEWLSASDNLKHSWKVLNRQHAVKSICNSKGEVFKSAKDAAMRYGVLISAISNCATGKTKTCVGMRWRYINGNSNNKFVKK